MKYFYTRLQLHSCVLSTLWIWHFNKIYLNQNTYKYNCSIPAQTLPWGSHLPSLNCSFWSDSWSLITFLVSQSRWTRQHPTAAMDPPLLAGTTNVTMSSEKSVSMHIVKLKTLYFPIHLINPPKHCLFTHYLSLINKPDSRKLCLLSINLLQALSLSMF